MRQLVCFATSILLAGSSSAQVPYGAIPDWFSTEESYSGTGAAIDDINDDGFPDLAISNGNDIQQAPNLVYINSNGILPQAADWISANIAYSGHCELGDYDSDGFPELAVSNYISSGWNPGQIQIYDNIDGSLETQPSWNSSESVYTFRLAWGDIDSDGDLDLAVATGESYYAHFQQNLVYVSDGGFLPTAATWISDDSDACYDIKWVDIDLDSDLDLAVCESGGPAKIYFNYGDHLATTPEWSTSGSDNYNSMDFADLNGDGFQEMALAANIQNSGSGKFKLYANDNGILETDPYWVSASIGYGSAVAFTDIDNDGDFDLVGGRWWGLVYVYLNNDGQFSQTPDWSSSGSYSSVIEKIVFGDFNAGAERSYRETFQSPGRLVYLHRRQLSGIDSVFVDGILLDNGEYCFSLCDGWLSFGVTPSETVDAFYRDSVSKDMAVSNWDRETYVYFNALPGFVPGDCNDSGDVNGLDVVYLVNYLKGGPAPIPRLSADVDGNCVIDAVDVVRLLDYLEGGPEPVVGDCD